MTKRYLVIEDDPYVSAMIERYLEALDRMCVGNASDVVSALEMVERLAFDAAILDVRLSNGETSEAVAAALISAKAPFLVTTGGFIIKPDDIWAGLPTLEKPFTLDQLGEALTNLEP